MVGGSVAIRCKGVVNFALRSIYECLHYSLLSSEGHEAELYDYMHKATGDMFCITI